jgi:chromatin segregation and condensation protein Rec8/ScpA/Scc1 (kleisin family)
LVDGAKPTVCHVYQLRLPPFEGPVDVPLRVIEGDQFALADVSPVAVTDPFLAHLTAMVAPPPAKVAAFSQVAARRLALMGSPP